MTMTKEHLMVRQNWIWLFGAFLMVVTLVHVWATAEAGLCSISRAIDPDSSAPCFEFWLYRYQALLGAFIAFLGAFLAFQGIRQQIAQVENLEADRRTRRAYAVRAILPLALDELSEYAGECIKQLWKVHPSNSHAGTIDLPPVPKNAIRQIQDGIEYADPERAKELEDLISHVQVQDSRLREIRQVPRFEDHRFLVRPRPSNITVIQGIIDSAEIFARTEDLFPYARHERDLPRHPSERIESVLNLNRVQSDDWPTLRTMISARRPKP